MTPTSSRAGSGLFAPAVTVAALVHLLVGYLYVISGLAVPGYALLPLWLWWGVLTALFIRFTLSRSWWVVVLPGVAFATWQVVLLAGDAWLGWTA